MAITQAVAKSFKKEMLDGVHLASHTYKMALFTSAAALDANTASYTGLSSEVPNGSGYTTGGKALTGRATSISGTTALLDFDDPVWTAATITARGAVIYNDSVAGKPVLMVLDFGVDVSSTSDNFTVDLPASGVATSLLRAA